MVHSLNNTTHNLLHKSVDELLADAKLSLTLERGTKRGGGGGGEDDGGTKDESKVWSAREGKAPTGPKGTGGMAGGKEKDMSLFCDHCLCRGHVIKDSYGHKAIALRRQQQQGSKGGRGSIGRS